jgi:hypothetical protein
VVYVYSFSSLIFMFVVWPIAVVYGWFRWTRADHERSLLPKLSFAGHAFATFSFVLAIGSVLAADKLGGLRSWDPTLLKFYRVGSMLSLVGLLLAITGAWRASPLRWPAPLAALGAMLFWFASASAE